MNEQLYIMILIPMVIILICGNLMVFRILKSKHVEKFNQLGQPSVIWNHSFKTSWNLIKFLVKREHIELKDKSLSLISDFVLVFSIIYLVVFFSIIVQIIHNAT